MLISVEEARAYAHDEESPDGEIQALIEVAESLIEDGCGTDFDRSAPQARMLAKLYVADLSDHRSLAPGAANARRELVSSMVLQLKTKTGKAAGAPT